MDALDIMSSRTVASKFNNKKVDRRQLAKILDAANRANSAGNYQTWKFIIVDGEKKKVVAMMHLTC